METLLQKNQLEIYVGNLTDEVLHGDFDEVYKNAPLPRSTHCGIGAFRGKLLQRLVAHLWSEPIKDLDRNHIILSDVQTRNFLFLFSALSV